MKLVVDDSPSVGPLFLLPFDVLLVSCPDLQRLNLHCADVLWTKLVHLFLLDLCIA